MNRNQKVGKFGEELVKDYLIRKGYEIIARNLKISYQEVDIIAKNGEYYIFVEVKTRTSNILGEADEAFDDIKMDNLNVAIAKYIEKNNINEKYVQIDLISVDINKGEKKAKIKHYKDIF